MYAFKSKSDRLDCKIKDFYLMPHYEYECTQCGKHFEYFQKMSDAPIEVCEACGGHLQKLLSAGSGLIFKGSGFYITDYKGKNASADTGSAGSGEKSKDSGGSGQGEGSKSAEKPAATPAKPDKSD
jgi:putative FmdB family regulatory protein